MATPTIIRYAQTPQGFVVVVTVLDHRGLEARVQVYKYYENTHKGSLEAEFVYSDEKTAIEQFERELI